MNKRISVILVVVMLLSLLAGCSGSNPQPSSQAPSSSAEASAPESSEPAGDGKVEQPANFPTKPIEWVVPAPAGAAIDVPARVLAEVMDVGSGKPVVIINKPGATQTLGTTEVLMAPADGYTLVSGANGNFMIQPSLLELNYKAEDFRHFSMITPADPMLLSVSPQSGIKTIEELIEKIKAGEALNYTAGNPGSIGHLAGEALLKGIGGENNVTFVPVTGTAEALTQLMGGHLDFIVIDNCESITRAAEGVLVPLLMFSGERTTALPDVPTGKEKGFENMEFYGFKWLAIHKDTPNEIVEWIKQQTNEAIKSETYQAHLRKNFGVDSYEPISEEEMTKIVFDSQAAYKVIIDELDLSTN